MYTFNPFIFFILKRKFQLRTRSCSCIYIIYIYKLYFKNSTYAFRLLINSNVLLPRATKWVDFINFSGPKRRFGRRDNADCKQRETKWSAVGADQSPIAACHKGTLPHYLIFSIIRIFLFSELLRFSGHRRRKWT